jgi:hypothetical protein
VTLACVVIALLPACAPPESTSNFHLATVAAAPEHGLLFVAQPGRGAVEVLTFAPPGAGDNAIRFVATLVHADRNHVLRLAVDRERGRLWVADLRITEVYGLPGLNLVRAYRPDSSAYHERYSDLALDGAGNAWVLSRGGARIYRIDANSLELEHWLDVDNRASDMAILLANRALTSADNRYLFLAAPVTGKLLQIAVNDKAVATVSGASANLSCGLLFWEQRAATIRALDCMGRWQAQIDIVGGSAAITIRGELPNAGSVTAFAPSTTGAVTLGGESE